MVVFAFVVIPTNHRSPTPHHSSYNEKAGRCSKFLLLSTNTDSSSDSSATNPFGKLHIKEGTIPVTRSIINTDKVETYELGYTIVRPMSLSSRKGAPVVVLHGGPSVPSNYLYPIATHIPYRSIVFYDQLGCGRISDEPTNMDCYSIENAVHDLEIVLKKLSITRFHLYGQSFGGILAYEYLKKKYTTQEASVEDDDDNNNNGGGCLSVVLSSTPTNVKQVEEEAQKLIDGLDSPDLFRETHQCRTPDMPQPLVDAYAAAGTVWRGTKAISNYTATATTDDEESGAAANTRKRRMPSAMILRGEYDFVTEICCEGWKSLFQDYGKSRSVRYKTLDGCSHHGLLENGPLYGETLDSFFTEYD